MSVSKIGFEGRRYIVAEGYWQRSYRRPDCGHTTTTEHRDIVTAREGRGLLHSEHVHHIDENGLNNDPQNLVLMSAKAHAEHHGVDRYDECRVTLKCVACLELFSRRKSVEEHNRNKLGKHGPFCSKKCVGKYYAPTSTEGEGCGTSYAYHHGCRCAPCVEAGARYRSKWTESARGTMPCGSPRAYNRGCRCVLCRAANAARARELRAMRSSASS